jgi:hypothetical protein
MPPGRVDFSAFLKLTVENPKPRSIDEDSDVESSAGGASISHA